MKNRILFEPVFLLVFFALTINLLSAQNVRDHNYRIQYQAKKYVPEENLKALKSLGPYSKSLSKGNYYILLQFYNIPGKDVKERVKEAGIELLSYMPENAYYASVPGSTSVSVLRSLDIRAIDSIPWQVKLSSLLRQEKLPLWTIKSPGTMDIRVEYFQGVLPVDAEAELARIGAEIQAHDKQNNMITARINQADLSKIGSLPIVMNISPISAPAVGADIFSQSCNKANILQSHVSGNRNLLGNGINICITDLGTVDTHVDFRNKLYFPHGKDLEESHPTYCGAIATGSGIRDPYAAGMAPGSGLYSFGFEDEQDLDTMAAKYHLDITTNSWSYGINPVYSYGAVVQDKLALKFPNLSLLWAAMNAGPNYKTVGADLQCAKNNITVGAIFMNQIAGFSSRGPTDDGRIKPEICAEGGDVYTGNLLSTYDQVRGTSTATPAVAGNIALLDERYKQLYGQMPDAALVKATICNTATDICNPGPDFNSGFGRMDGFRAIRNLEAGRFFHDTLSHNDTVIHSLIIPHKLTRLRVLLYWPDHPGNLSAAKILVNNLDLKIITPSNDTILPWVLDTANLSKLATRGIDSLNNIEQVTLDTAAAGTYKIMVTGTTIPYGPQPCVVSYELDTPHLMVTYPFGGESFSNTRQFYTSPGYFYERTGSNVIIRWEAEDPGGNFTISFSADSGKNWSKIATVADTIRDYQWTVPTIQTSKGLIKVSTATMSDISDSIFNIMPSTYLKFVNLSAKKIYLAWDKLKTASAYDVMRYDSVAYTKIATVTSDTFFIDSNVVKNFTYWYAIICRDSNGATSMRSVAFPGHLHDTSSLAQLDAGVSKLLTYNRGRQYMQRPDAFTASTSLNIQVKNYGYAILTKIPVAYSINNGTPKTETLYTKIGTGYTSVFTFTAKANFLKPGTYNLKFWTALPGDTVHSNDTLETTIVQLPDPTCKLPYKQGFENIAQNEYDTFTIGMDGAPECDYSSATPGYGRLQTEASATYKNYAETGSNAATMDSRPNYYSIFGFPQYLYSFTRLAENYLTLTLNLDSFKKIPLHLGFSYMLHGGLYNYYQIYYKQCRVWIRGTDSLDWIEVYDPYAHGAIPGKYTDITDIHITDTLKKHKQVPQRTFQVKFGQVGDSSTIKPAAEEGITFDNIKIWADFTDLSPISLDSPVSSCTASSANKVEFTVSNLSNTTTDSFRAYVYLNKSLSFLEKVSATINGGSKYTYTCKNMLSLSKPGKYLVTIVVKVFGDTNAANDTFSKMIYIYKPVVPTVTASATGICFGDSAQLKVSGGFLSYKWNNGDTARYIYSKDTAHYFVATVDSQGCVSSSAPINLSVWKPLVKLNNPFPGSLCKGDSALLKTTDSFSSYQWSNGKTTSSIYIKDSSLYFVSVVDSHGCSASSAPVHFTILPAPVVNLKPLGPGHICTGDSILVYNTKSFANYLWSNGKTTPSIFVKDSNQYSVTVTDSNGCSAGSLPIKFTMFPKPTVKLSSSGSTYFCAGDSVLVSTTKSFSNYLWSNSITAPSIYVKDSNQYSVLVTDSNGCSALSSTVQFGIWPKPQVKLNPPGQVHFCFGDSVFVNATAGFRKYVWSDGEAGESIYIKDSSTYSVLVTDSNSCTSSAGPVQFSEWAKPFVHISPTSPVNFCTGDSILVKATPGFKRYHWNTNEVSPGIYIKKQGTFSVSASDSNGCTASDSATAMADSLPNAYFTYSDTGSAVYFTSVGKSIKSYLWTFGDGSTDTVKNPVHSYSSSKKYTISLAVINPYGCENTFTDSIDLITTYIKGAFNRNDMWVDFFPNPFKDQATISVRLLRQSHITAILYDMNGKQIAEIQNATLPGGNYSYIFDPVKYNVIPGLYQLKVISDKDVVSRKIIKIN